MSNPPPKDEDMLKPTHVAMVILAMHDFGTALNTPDGSLPLDRLVELLKSEEGTKEWEQANHVCVAIAEHANDGLLMGYAAEIFEDATNGE